MSRFAIGFILALIPWGWASPVQGEGCLFAQSGFSAAVTIQAEFVSLGIRQQLRGTYSAYCGNIRFDFHAEDDHFPTDVSVIASQKENKLFVLSHASKSYFVDTLDRKNLNQIYPSMDQLFVPLTRTEERTALAERRIRGHKCQEYVYGKPNEDGTWGRVCLDSENSDRPLAIALYQRDGTKLFQEIGPYTKKEFSQEFFVVPKTYRKENVTVSQLVSLFLEEPLSLGPAAPAVPIPRVDPNASGLVSPGLQMADQLDEFFRQQDQETNKR